MKRTWALIAAAALAATGGAAAGQVCNLRVVTDASPDYHDLPGLLHSATSNWSTPAEKCWALFYWTHIARRQTTPMHVHGLELTDPVRQANDYGYTMCSTVAGINCAVWDALGLPVRYWDITRHTVSECFYDGREYRSLGLLRTDLRWKDLPVNHLWPDHECIQGDTFRLVPPGPVEARWVRYRVTAARSVAVTELEVLDAITVEPFDLRVALPADAPPAGR